MTASPLRLAAILQSLTVSKNVSAVSTLAFHFSTSSGMLVSLNNETRGTMQAWKQNHTAFQPEMRSGMHSWLISPIVFDAMSRHLPTASFSSALRATQGERRSAAVSRIGRWRMIRMFWKRHFITSLVRRRNSGHGSSGLERIDGSSSCHFTICAS